MPLVVNKTDALVEMVKAHDSQQTKRANLIGQLLCDSIQNENGYNSYIKLNRDTKQMFPTKIRRIIHEQIEDMGEEVRVVIDGKVYKMRIKDGTILLYENENTTL